MSFYTELHAHTSETSPCSHQTASQVADRYLAEGYSTVVVANHYCEPVFRFAEDSPEARVEYFLAGYRAMKDYAGDRLNVILGMELRFVGDSNDYLIFGINEDFVRANPDLHLLSLKKFRPIADEQGFLIIQAHPFRNGMTVRPPALLDGYEVFNGHAGHDSRNHLAAALCRTYGKIPTSGSDFHDATSYVAGGIETEEEIKSMEQLMRVLRSECYTLRCGGPAAERDGMKDFKANEL